jgi:translation initiation factor eIF-2B subunit delta
MNKNDKKLEKQLRRAAAKDNHSQQDQPKPSSAAPKPTSTHPMESSKPPPLTSSKSQQNEIPSSDHITLTQTSALVAHLNHPTISPLPSFIPSNRDHSIHPEVIQLAIQYSQFKVRGSNNRCLALISVFKTLIRQFRPPPSQIFNIALLKYLNPQIDHLSKSSRSLSVSMGNMIRFLKSVIVKLQHDVQEDEAKDYLIEVLEDFERDRIELAGKVMIGVGSERIKNGDVVCIYGR